MAKQTKDRKVILDELLSVLLAGRNTTASLLSFMFFELAQNKPVWNKLKKKSLNISLMLNQSLLKPFIIVNIYVGVFMNL